MALAVLKKPLRRAGAICAGTVVLQFAAVLALHSSRVPAAAAPSGVTEQLEEIEIRGQRARLPAMRKQLMDLEDRFYARYNELNPVADFDIHCVKEARTGTRFIRRTCRAVYEDKAFAEEGEGALHIRQYMQDALSQYKFDFVPDPKQPSGPPAPPLFAILARLPDFQKNMKKVVSRHPELLDILRERAQVIREYEALRRKIFSPGRESGDEEDDGDEERATPEDRETPVDQPAPESR